MEAFTYLVSFRIHFLLKRCNLGTRDVCSIQGAGAARVSAKSATGKGVNNQLVIFYHLVRQFIFGETFFNNVICYIVMLNHSCLYYSSTLFLIFKSSRVSNIFCDVKDGEGSYLFDVHGKKNVFLTSIKIRHWFSLHQILIIYQGIKRVSQFSN